MTDTSFRIRYLCNADVRSGLKNLSHALDMTLQDATDFYKKVYMKKAALHGDPFKNNKQE